MARPTRAKPPSGARRKPAVTPKKAKCFDWLGRPIRCPSTKKKKA